MAINAAKQLLDELMGRGRDLAPNESSSLISYNDSSICKFYLVKFCPYSLFTNTKADIGHCSLVHDDGVKRNYAEKASRREKRVFEEDFVRFCQDILTDVDKKIKRAKQRLEASQRNQNGITANLTLSEEAQQRVDALTEKIEKKLEEIEQLGCDGKVEEAQEAMKEIYEMKDERERVKRNNQSGHWIQQKAEIGANQEKQMEVCDVCGAFLIVNDVQQRVEDHLMGKQHQGYGRIKTAIDELLETWRKTVDEDNPREKDRDNRRESREREHRHRDREARRDRDRHRRYRSRSPDHWRSSDRHRSRDRYRHSSTNDIIFNTKIAHQSYSPLVKFGKSSIEAYHRSRAFIYTQSLVRYPFTFHSW